MTEKLILNIGWLYPDLMSTYGDRGNIIVLKKRAELRGIDVKIIPINQTISVSEIGKVDLIFGGGSQDIQQEIVMRDLREKKAEIIKKMIEKDIPALFVCGAPQIMGKFYEPAFGKRIEGLGIFDMETINPGKNMSRCIGNIVALVNWENLDSRLETSQIVGFENHGGRTYLGSDSKPFAKVIRGFGNNGEDGTEGVVYKNAIGCYFHGPLLPKNPIIADYLLQKALEVKYNKKIKLDPLNDTLEKKALDFMIHKLT